MKNNLFIHHHLGLGDCFDCNGMVRFILEEWGYNQVTVFSKDNYFDMIDFMYRDNDNINVIKIDKNREYEEIERVIKDSNRHENDFLVVGHYNYDDTSKEKNCWEIFYDQVKIPYSVRKDSFYVERNLEEEQRLFSKLNPNNEPFVFLHDDEERGFALDRGYILNKDLRVIENEVSENIFYFIKILQEADEVHSMESSFKTLIDLYCNQEKLFFHDFRGHPLGSQSNKNWKTIKYEQEQQ